MTRQHPPPDTAIPLDAWPRRGRRHRIFGHEVFTLDTETETETAAPLLLLHGFPSSSLDFRPALPRLAAARRVIVHDHLGFGASDKPALYSYSLVEQAEVALALWRELGVTAGHLVAHDYGTSVATELLARRERGGLPIEIRSVTLCNGSVHLDLAHLTPSQQLLRAPIVGPIFARLASEPVFTAQLRGILGSPRSIPDADLHAMWLGMIALGGRRRLAAIAGYMNERVRFRERWIGALTRLDLPAHVLWGRRDPVALPAVAEALAAEIPGARTTWLDELGHYPMLEAPDRWAAAAMAFLDALDGPGR
jgi:pimeloyl-ACP methyl ester carboxylesterase